MLKKVLLAAVTVLLVITTSLTFAFAEPNEDSSLTESVSSVEVSSEESVSGDEDEGGSSSTESIESTTTSNTSSKTESKFYIKDDSDFYNESLNELGGNASTVVSKQEADSTSSVVAPSTDKNLAGVEKFMKFIWIPIGVIALCILVLVCFNRIYKVKYEPIDPTVRKKPNGNSQSRSGSSQTRRPRD